MNASTSAVLPMPASPVTKTVRRRPARRRRGRRRAGELAVAPGQRRRAARLAGRRGRGGDRRVRQQRDRGHEAEADAVRGRDVARRRGVVAEGKAQLADRPGQRRIGDDAAGPHGVEELGLGEELAWAAEQGDEEGEGLLGHRHGDLVAHQPMLPRIDFERPDPPVPAALHGTRVRSGRPRKDIRNNSDIGQASRRRPTQDAHRAKPSGDARTTCHPRRRRHDLPPDATPGRARLRRAALDAGPGPDELDVRAARHGVRRAMPTARA